LIIRRKKPCCYVSPFDKHQIIQRFRDYANVGHLLEIDVMILVSQFKERLRKFGWSDTHIDEMENIAYSSSNWEEFLPRIRSRGNWFEYIRNRGRLK